MLVGSVECTLGDLDDKWCVREGEILENLGILRNIDISRGIAMTAHRTHGCWHISASDPLNGCVKVVKSFTLNYLSTDFASDTKGRETTFNDK